MEKRTECFVQLPQVYEIKCDVCGGDNLNWSEFDKKIWCYDCEIDTQGTRGIFDSPVPIELCKMLGISFDKIDLKTNKIIPFNGKSIL